MRLITFIVLFLFVLGCDSGKKTTRIIEIPSELPTGNAPPLPPKKPDFLGFDWFEQDAVDDAQTLPEQKRIFTRYIWNPRFNEKVSQVLLNQIQDGINFGMNSLSSERDVEETTATGSTGAMFRIDLRDYGWTPRDWDALVQRAAIPVLSNTIRGQTLRFLTQTNYPWLYAGDLFTTAFNSPGLYYFLVKSPGVNSLDDFFAGIGVNPQREFDDLEAILTGFTQSTISLQKNRLLQRLDSADGSVYSTFDTDVNGDNLFEDPFPFEARSNREFIHDAQEHLYTLPNGLLGYRLNAAVNQSSAGEAQDEAPITVVIDNKAAIKGLDPIIRPLSCSRCHFSGVLSAEDQIGPHIQSSPGFGANDKLRALNLFKRDAFVASIDKDNRRMGLALNIMGMSRSDIDPLNEGVTDTHRLEQNIVQISALFFLSPDAFANKLRASNDAAVQVGNLLNGGSIGLDQLKASFNVIIKDLNLFVDRDQVNN